MEASLQDILWHLRGLATASVPRDDHHAISVEFLNNLSLVLGDGQSFGAVTDRLRYCVFKDGCLSLTHQVVNLVLSWTVILIISLLSLTRQIVFLLFGGALSVVVAKTIRIVIAICRRTPLFVQLSMTSLEWYFST